MGPKYIYIYVYILYSYIEPLGNAAGMVEGQGAGISVLL